MESRSTQSGFTISGRIDKQVHDVDELREEYPSWDEMSKQEKLKAVRETEPAEEETVYNVTTDRFHEYIVDNLDPSQTSVEDNVASSHLALGTDSASGTTSSDTDLNNRTYNEPVTDHADNGKELLASTFLDSTEGNGNTFDELGLFTGDPANLANAEVFLLNHATFASVTKDNSKTVTFDVTLTFSDV